jgi:polyphenol oxidase
MHDLFTFKIFHSFPELIHGFTLNKVNYGLTPNHDENEIHQNRKALFQSLGIEKIAFMHQIHSALINFISFENYQKKRQCDGMTTNAKNLALFSISADCQPALFYDPSKKVIANVHAGWRGQVANIYAQTVKHLQKEYGCNPSDLFVGIGPSLGPEASEFVNFQKEIPKKYWEFQFKPFYFDLWALAKHQLMEAGIPERQIEIARICTYSHPDRCFSHRRDPRSGRHASVICFLDLAK